MLSIFPKKSIGAEIGVLKGDFSEKILNIVYPKKLYLVDLWKKQHKGTYINDPINYWPLDEFYQLVKNKFKTKKEVFLIRKNSVESLFEIKEKLDWVYLDADHSLMQSYFDLYHWFKKIKNGGFLCGHDYCFYEEHPHLQTKFAVDLFLKNHKLKLYAITTDKFPSFVIRKEIKMI